MKLVRPLAVAAAVLALGLVPAAAAVAQMMSPSVHFGATGGVSIPLGDFSTGFQTGYLVSGLVEGRPGGFPVGLRGEVSYSGYTVKSGGFTNNILGFLGNAVVNFETPSSGAYLIGGLGIYHSSNSGLAGAASSNDFGINGGGGFRWPLGGMSTFAEARVHFVSTSGSSTTFLPIVFGVVF